MAVPGSSHFRVLSSLPSEDGTTPHFPLQLTRHVHFPSTRRSLNSLHSLGLSCLLDSSQDTSTSTSILNESILVDMTPTIPPPKSLTSTLFDSAILVFILKGFGSEVLKDFYKNGTKWVLNRVARNFPGQYTPPKLVKGECVLVETIVEKDISIPRLFKRGFVVSVGLGSVKPDHLCIATLFRRISFGPFTKTFPLLHFGIDRVKPGNTVVFPKDVGTILEPNGPDCPECVLLKEDEILGMLSSDNREDIIPLKDRILLKLPERVSDMIGGHFADHSIGMVVAVGSGPIDANGHEKLLPFSRGNSVIYSNDGPKEYKDSKYVVVKAEDIVLVRPN